MRVFALAAASLGLAIVAVAPLAPAAAAGPTITVQNVESRNSVNGCGQFRFDADIVASNWPAGMAHVVKYHWARASNHAWPMRTITIGPSGKMHVRAELNPQEAHTGFAWVHVYSPVNFRSAKVGFSNSEC
jgi:hypothetical protein